MTNEHLNLKFLIIADILYVFRFEIQKFRIWDIFNLITCMIFWYSFCPIWLYRELILWNIELFVIYYELYLNLYTNGFFILVRCNRLGIIPIQSSH